MATDNLSGLPIRSEADGLDEKVIVKIVDGTPGGSNQVSVDADKNAHVEMHGDAPDGTTDTVMRLSESGHPNGNGDYDASLNSDPASVGLILHDRVASPAKADQNFRPTGIASSDGSNAKALDVGIRDEDGNAFTTSNPLPVTLVDSEGSEVNDYEEDLAVAKDATASHDYTVTAGKTMKLSKIEASSAGRARFYVKVETGVGTGIFTTKFKKRTNASDQNVTFDVKELITVAAGVKIRVEYTNDDNAAMDFNSTISGHEIP